MKYISKFFSIILATFIFLLDALAGADEPDKPKEAHQQYFEDQNNGLYDDEDWG